MPSLAVPRRDALAPDVLLQIRARGAQGIKPRRKKQPVWLYPHGVEQRYSAQLVEFVDDIEVEIEKIIIPNLQTIIDSRNAVTPQAARDDDYADEIDRLMQGLTLSVNNVPFDKDAVARAAANGINDFNDNQWQRQIKSALGVDVFQREPFLNSALNSFAKENVSLVTKMSDDLLSSIEEIVQRGARQGDSAARIAEDIRKKTGVSKSRAKLIARDQAGKLNGQLAELRQTNLGVDSYIWQTSEDIRVRPTHRAHKEKSFKWSQPPASTGHPGQDYQCRCYAEPNFTSVLGESFREQDTPPVAVAPTPRPRRRAVTPPIIKRPKAVKPSAFEPSATVKDAEVAAKAADLATYVRFDGIDVDMANAIVSETARMKSEYPRIRKKLGFIGSKGGQRKTIMDINFERTLERFKEANGTRFSEAVLAKAARAQISKLSKRMPRNVYAWASPSSIPEYGGMIVNDVRTWAQMQTGVVANIKSGYHPIVDSGKEAISVITHELGHVLDYAYELRAPNSAISTYYNTLSAREIADGLSKYALKNKAEFIAESWAEYKNSSSPRPIALKVGKMIDKAAKGVK